MFSYSNGQEISFKEVYIDSCGELKKLPFNGVLNEGRFRDWFGSGSFLTAKFGEGISSSLTIYRTGTGELFIVPHVEGDVDMRGLFIHISLPRDDFKTLLINGMQSWSATYITHISNSTVPLEDHYMIDEFYDLSLTDPRVSWWFTLLLSDEKALLAGALSFDVWKSRFFVWKKDGAVHLYIYSGNTKNCVKVHNEDFGLYYLGVDKDMWSGMRRYAELLKMEYPPPSEPFNPVGWNSWNTFFDEVTLEDVLKNAEFIRDNLSELQINNIQVDDGWEVMWGDWNVNDKFGGSFESITRPIMDMGFIPGIWIAPLLADENSEVFKRHPAWFLKDENGNFITIPDFSGRTIYILDLSHPSVLPWIEENILKLLDAGFRYLKLDFLYTALIEGDFMYKASTLQNYRALMGRILEIAEKYSAYVLACGAPFLPSIGLVHGIRTGGDIAVKNAKYHHGFVYNELRNHIIRSVFNPVIRGDPDTLLLRDISVDVGRAFAYAIVYSGGIFALGDDLPSLSDEKIEILREVAMLPYYPPSRELQFECEDCDFSASVLFPVPNFIFGDPFQKGMKFIEER